jgi:hypothetical protein
MSVLTLVDNRGWVALGILAWLVIGVLVSLLIGAIVRLRDEQAPAGDRQSVGRD